LNKIYNQAVSDISVVNNLQDSIIATYSVSGAIDEDHTQLRTLENETKQTALVISNLLSEVGNDYTRQVEYTNTARHYLNSLDDAIKIGSYGVANPLIPVNTNNRYSPSIHTTPVLSSSLNPTVRKSTKTSDVKGKPLFVAKFSRANVNYKDSLQSTIQAAQSKNTAFHYDVVAVTPVNASKSTIDLAQNQAALIFEQITQQGINADKINLISKNSEKAVGAEVQIFVK
jgi:hypothetical protein